jgi:amidohydrolase
MTARALLAALAGALAAAPSLSAAPPSAAAKLRAEVDRRAEAVVPKVVAWRRDFHEHPELGNQEVRTGKIVAEHLRGLGIDVKTGVAKTGVVGVLVGGRPGPVVALRSDMDALPVREEVDVPFKSHATAVWEGKDVSVMHACGHDNHLAILMGTAEVLAGMKAELPGTVKFVFQPSEEGPPQGEEGGAPLMVKEGVLESPKVDAIFGLHVFPYETGSIVFKPAGIMAASDNLDIKVRGSQTHGALPWAGVDPVVVGAQIVLGLQTIVSRQEDLTIAPAIVTIGSFHGGARRNIIPDQVEMQGTIRTFDRAMREDVRARVKRTAEQIAAAAGATAEVSITGNNPVTYNDPALTARMAASLERVAPGKVNANGRVTTAAEDFAAFQEKVPGMFFFLGITPKDADPKTVAPNHSPRFFADEGALVTGVRAMSSLAVDFLAGAGK